MATSPHAAYDSKRNQRQLARQMEQTENEYKQAPDADYNLNLSDNMVSSSAHNSER